MAEKWLAKIKTQDGQVYWLKDSAARDSIQSLESALTSLVASLGDAAYRGVATSINDTDSGLTPATLVYQAIKDISQFKYKIVTELPEAKAENMGIIFLYKESGKSVYSEYIVIDHGESADPRYTLEKFGDLDVDLTQYAKISYVDASISAVYTSISAEATARISADSALGDRIDAEESARISADSALQSAINAEASARISADSALDSRITELVQTAVTDVTYTINGSGKGELAKEINGTPTQVHVFGKLAEKDSATGQAASQTITGVTGTASCSDDLQVTYTTASAAATISREDYTPAGTVGVSAGDSYNRDFYEITDVGTAASKAADSWTANTPTTIDVTKFSQGTLASWTGATYTAPTLGAATSSAFAIEGMMAAIDASDSECLSFASASTNNALTGQGTLSGGSVDFGTFDQGALPCIEAGFYTAGTAASFTEGSFTPNTVASMAPRLLNFTGTKATDLRVASVSYNTLTELSVPMDSASISVSVGDIVVPSHSVTVS